MLSKTIHILVLTLTWSKVVSLQLPRSSPRHRDETAVDRRAFTGAMLGSAGAAFLLPNQVRAVSLSELQATTQQARNQLDSVPDIIQAQQWDKVRAILITPPISDFWTTTKKGSHILKEIPDAVGDAGGHELSIREFREDIQSHL